MNTKRCLVLLVEDNPIVRRIAQLHLRRFAIGVHTAVDGVEAVEAAALRSYDLILMDIQLPRLSGIDATRQIRLDEGSTRPRVPIVAVTASAPKAPCLDAGMDDYIEKPADYDRILRRWLPTYFEAEAEHSR